MKKGLIVSLMFLMACAKPSNSSAPKAPEPPVMGSLTSIDTTTQGAWHGIYGNDGYIITNDAMSLPSYVVVNLGSPAVYTWQTNCGLKCLQNHNNTGTIASTMYGNMAPFSIDVEFTDGKNHQVELYYMDFDNNARVASLRVLDAVTGSVLLDSLQVDDFKNGKYVVLNLKGHVKLEFTGVSGGTPNIINAILFN